MKPTLTTEGMVGEKDFAKMIEENAEKFMEALLPFKGEE